MEFHLAVHLEHGHTIFESTVLIYPEGGVGILGGCVA